jgi:hypothetical protein
MPKQEGNRELEAKLATLTAGLRWCITLGAVHLSVPNLIGSFTTG